MRVLHVVGGLPSPRFAALQPFVASQIESLRRAGLRLDVLDLSSYGDGWKKYLRGVGEMRGRVHESEYDLIHAHYAYCGWVSRSQHRTPVVVSLMGDDLMGSPDARGRQTLRGRADVCATRILVRCVDHIIVKSDEMARLVSRQDAVSVVPNGVDFELFKPMDRSLASAHFGLDPQRKAILFVANPAEKRKNFRLAREAVDVLRSRVSFDCLLWPFYGHSQAEVPIAMNAADVLLVTSYQEGSSNAIKEAMACDLPVVSVRVGDASEIISGTQNCQLADYDPSDIAAKLAFVLGSGQRSNGRQRIERLRLETVAGKLIGVYSHVLEQICSARNGGGSGT